MFTLNELKESSPDQIRLPNTKQTLSKLAKVDNLPVLS